MLQIKIQVSDIPLQLNAVSLSLFATKSMTITYSKFCLKFCLKKNRMQADSAPLMTRAMREVREEAEMYKYDKVGTSVEINSA